MGLFDTVASSGLASSSNTVNFVDAAVGTVRSHIWVRRHMYPNTRSDVLAFSYRGKPGADPNPGKYDGHKAFGERMQIHPMVQDVRHFLAGHEFRNSFPVDSLAVRQIDGSYFKPSHFYEYVYPGVHSDVGGSYRPGEGGKNADPSTKLGLVTLHAMYQFALAAGVPMVAVPAFDDDTTNDFALHTKVLNDFGYYFKNLSITKRNLGGVFNAHMRLYYQWKFHVIRRKLNGDMRASVAMQKSASAFELEQKNLSMSIKDLEKEYESARRTTSNKLALLSPTRGSSSRLPGQQRRVDQQAEVARAQRLEADAYDALLRARAKLSALPKEATLSTVTDIYEQQLMEDARDIYQTLTKPGVLSITRGFSINRSALRPHYRALIDAYEDEFVRGKGLKDKRIIEFFDNYVHDSLSAFGKDGTLPSDPRVIYTGGDDKLPYAATNSEETSRIDTRMA